MVAGGGQEAWVAPSDILIGSGEKRNLTSFPLIHFRAFFKNVVPSLKQE